MNPETKIALALIGLLLAGLCLVAFGAGLLSSKLGALITGIVVVGTALRLLAIVWRGR
jgi:hypothetical protein